MGRNKTICNITRRATQNNNGIYDHMHYFYMCVGSSCKLISAADVTYLEWIERTGINPGVIRQCLDCNSVKIILPSPFPFGDYYNNSVYVSQSEL